MNIFASSNNSQSLYLSQQQNEEESETQQYSEQFYMQILKCIENISEINQRNQHFYVEIIRNLAEYIIYSEQNKDKEQRGAYFDLFCERNMMEHFTKILALNNRHVNIQLIQTTSIFLNNISQETKKYYILCHPFLNKLIEFNFNFYDEELVDIYVSFIKSLALLLNENSIQFFYNQKNKHFPLFFIAQKFANHPETMVRNAVRIINLTVFKINDKKLNEEIISDVPYCLTFVHLACLLRHKVCTGVDQSYACQNYIQNLFAKKQPQAQMQESFEMINLDPQNASQQPQEANQSGSGEVASSNNLLMDFLQAITPEQNRSNQDNNFDQNQQSLNQTVKFDKILDFIEDVEDILEFVQEIFEIENQTTRRLMCNAVMHYFYLPVIVGSLTGSQITPNQVSVNTALFILNKTLKMVTFQPLINSICIALLSKDGPARIVHPKMIQNDLNLNNDSPPTFTPEWHYRIPTQYKSDGQDFFLTEFYNQSCMEAFLLDTKFERCINQDISNALRQANENVETQISKGIASYEQSPGGFEQTPESEKFVIQDSELRNQQSYLSDVNEFTLNQDDDPTVQKSLYYKASDQEQVEDANNQQERDTVVQNPDLYNQLQSQKISHSTHMPSSTADTTMSPQEQRKLYIMEVYNVLYQSNLIDYNKIVAVEINHQILSYALGFPVGIVKTQKQLNIKSISGIVEQIEIQSIIDCQYEYLMKDVAKNKQQQASNLIQNNNREMFMKLLCNLGEGDVINDQLVLQQIGVLAQLVRQCEGVSHALLHHQNLYPIGYRRKNLQFTQQQDFSGNMIDLNYQESSSEIDKINNMNVADKDYKSLMKLQETYDIKYTMYDDRLVTYLIQAIQNVDKTGDMTDPKNRNITRIFTFRSICILLIYLTYNKNQVQLKQIHMTQLLLAFKNSIHNLKTVMQTNMAEIVPEVLEEEFNKFKLNLMVDNELDQIDRLMENPLIMLPSINDRQINRRVPPQLAHSSKAFDVLINKIQIFLTLRQVVNTLGGNSLAQIEGTSQIVDSGYAGIDVNPIAREVTVIHQWQTGSSYQLPSVNVELILCNQRVSKKMCVRYVMIDPEFFILIEPDFTVSNENRIIIHQKVPLRHVESLVDKQDQRNLVIGFAVFMQNQQQNPQAQKSDAKQQFTTQEILLYFENTGKCTYVKNMLDVTKKTFKQQQISKANAFFDKNLKQYGLF